MRNETIAADASETMYSRSRDAFTALSQIGSEGRNATHSFRQFVLPVRGSGWAGDDERVRGFEMGPAPAGPMDVKRRPATRRPNIGHRKANTRGQGFATDPYLCPCQYHGTTALKNAAIRSIGHPQSDAHEDTR